MNELMIFNNPEFGEIRTVVIDGEMWFVGKDVAMALGYANPWNAIDRHVDKEDTLKRGYLTKGGEQQTTIINESGLYALIILSEKPNAKIFKRWITKEVIPSIMKTGNYSVSTQPALTQNELILQMAQSNVDMERRITVIEEKEQAREEKLDTALQIIASSSGENWRGSMERQLKALPGGLSARSRIYKEIEDATGVLLGVRLKRLRKRVRKNNGATYREAMALTMMDVIARDKQLRTIFEGILKRYQALHSLDGQLYLPDSSQESSEGGASA